MNTSSNETKQGGADSTGAGLKVAVQDWVECDWQVSVQQAPVPFEFSRNRTHRSEPMITILVPFLTRAHLSNHRSHLIVGRSS